ncbi:Spy/CpxP family protein refolding chaperone [Marinomonas posidonica]|uniref:Zinc resistance-associated protein n=1 Tax=Marinomonas posidonica (strain CECT 7376 / NCIMB 14433 / IVIA-Po-181) TaxID=491952 RepID=F6CSD2_MARPP|nr:hypothetical protein [Marinomonas posidonica]AEF54986.1 hypothetical protein Mar181_1948 [Marinomonas posidonica IVIA-Po-181]
MLTNKRTARIAVICLGIALMAGVTMKAFAEPEEAKIASPNHQQLAERIAEKLGLNRDVEQKVSELFERDGQKIHKIQEQLHKTQVALSQLTPNSKGYLKQVDALADKSAKQTKALTMAYAENRASLYELLTPKQIKMLETPATPDNQK